MYSGSREKTINQRARVCASCNKIRPISFFINLKTLMLNDYCSNCIQMQRIFTFKNVKLVSRRVEPEESSGCQIACVPQSQWVEVKTKKKSLNIYTARYIYHRLYSYCINKKF